MNTLNGLVSSLVLLALTISATAQTKDFVSTPGVEELSGRMIVRPRQELAGESVAKGDPGARLNRELVLSQIGHLLVRRFEMTDDFVVLVPPNLNETEFAEILMQTGLYQYAEPDWIVYPCATPNDPFFANQWHHTQIGSQRAWDFTSSLGNDANVIVAFTDTGVRTNHPDLAPNLVPGYDAVNQLAQTNGGSVEDNLGHGTSIAGIIGAKGNNGIGVAGVGWNLKLMPIRLAEDPNGGGASPIARILDGMQWAAQHGAKVVNTSYSGVSNPAVQTTAAAIRTLGCMSVWGAGNTNTALDSFDWPDVIIVGGTDQNDAKWVNSNYGVAIDLMAPCVSIYTTRRSTANPYGTNPPGTSWAAAVVSGSLGLLRAAYPSESLNKIEWRLQRGCKDLGADGSPRLSSFKPGNDLTYGWGRANVTASFELLPTTYSLFALPDNLLIDPVYVNASMVNSSGEIYGTAETSGQFYKIGWDRNRQMQILWPGGFNWSSINGIAQSGQFYGSEHGTFRAARGLTSFETCTFDFGPNRHSIVERHNRAGHCALNIAVVPVGGGNPVWSAGIWYGGSSAVDYGTLLGGIESRSRFLTDSGLLGVNVKDPSNKVQPFMVRDGIRTQLPNPFPTGSSFVNQCSQSEIAIGYGYISGLPEIAWSTAIRSAQMELLQPLVNGLSEEAYDIDGLERIFGVSEESAGNWRYVLWEGPQNEKQASLIQSRIVDNGGFNIHYGNFSMGGVNELGEFVGTAQFGNRRRAFVAKVRESETQSNYDLGQTQSGPIIGAILPNTLKLDFLDANTNDVRASLRLPYNKDDGSLRYPLPIELEGQPYRVYVRPCAEDYTASSQDEGPGYLGKLYPPIGSQPLPPDTTYIEMQDLIPGDINYDNEVNLVDVGILTYAFGSTYGDPNYIHAANIDGDLDNEITLVDFGMLAAYFGQSGDEDPTP